MEQTLHLPSQKEKLVAKLLFVAAFQPGRHWREATQAAGLTIGRSSAYRYRKEYTERGIATLQDGRQGHPSKLKPTMREWLIQHCRANPHLTSPQLQKALHQQFAQTISVSYLDEVRRKLKINRQALTQTGETSPAGAAKKK
jgi:transposase